MKSILKWVCIGHIQNDEMLPDAIPEARDVGQIGLDYSTQQENGSATVSLKIPLF